MRLEELAGWTRAWSHTGTTPPSEPVVPSGLDDHAKRQVRPDAALTMETRNVVDLAAAALLLKAMPRN